MVESASPGQANLPIPVDAHVHFHRRNLVASTLDAAAGNFMQIAGPLRPLQGVLLLAQAENEAVFEQLREMGRAGSWQLWALPGEPQTVVAESGGCRLAVVCGRQVQCAHGLEVLALGTVARFPEGKEVSETLDAIRRVRAVGVIPWGFGKWTGRRGEIVKALLEKPPARGVFLGDNGGRLEAAGMPRLLRHALEHGFRILPGTDPFPFGDDHRRVGAFGFRASIEPDPAAPWSGLREWLEGQTAGPPAYGRALGPWRFTFNQAWIQVRKRVGKRGGR
jgi:hypothetical protein